MLQDIIGLGGRVLEEPCQKANCAEHTRLPQGFVKEPSSLGSTGILSVLLQPCKEVMVPWVLLL